MKERLRTAKQEARLAFSVVKALMDHLTTEIGWILRRAARRTTKLDPRVVVSLTSYPPRFRTLHLTLKTILLQSVRPAAVVLWIAQEDSVHLPANVLALKRWGLEIHLCENLRSYKKLVPALDAYKCVAVVTADDDVVYWRTWLADLLDQYTESSPEILCHRMHVVRTNSDGLPDSYRSWHWCSESLQKNPLNFATGVGGVLYPPNVFDSEATNVDRMRSLCPQADDVWFYWMARARGILVRKVPSSGAVKFWLGSQDVALWKSNLGSDENDVQIAAMIKEYGFMGGP
ncbi:hypothetical protein PQR67_28785 [Paraburkholderia fungorum]|uniref:hypothetical protein n=1 Tax=Paraburkholderia fungorum TaxID=134537 RepID=UPI0038B6C871